jgi:hypothetical protein
MYTGFLLFVGLRTGLVDSFYHKCLKEALKMLSLILLLTNNSSSLVVALSLTHISVFLDCLKPMGAIASKCFGRKDGVDTNYSVDDKMTEMGLVTPQDLNVTVVKEDESGDDKATALPPIPDFASWMSGLKLDVYVQKMTSSDFGISPDDWTTQIPLVDEDLLKTLGMNQIQAKVFTTAAQKLNR